MTFFTLDGGQREDGLINQFLLSSGDECTENREVLIVADFDVIFSTCQPSKTTFHEVVNMTKCLFGTVALGALFMLETVPVAAQPAPLKGTVCFANLQRDSEPNSISCKGLGKFASVAELYERGYRVVSSGVLPSTGPGTAFLIIEERK